MASNSNTENSFKRLEDEAEQQFPHPPPEIEQNVMGTARNVKFMGNVVELYLSRFLEIVVSIFGGSLSKGQEQHGGEADIDLNNSPEGSSSKKIN